MDIYSEKLPLPPSIPGLNLAGGFGLTLSDSDSIITSATELVVRTKPGTPPILSSEPLGLGKSRPKKQETKVNGGIPALGNDDAQLPPPYKATSLPPVDRLAARDSAFGLLSTMKKLG